MEFHVHTRASWCAERDSSVAAIRHAAHRRGLDGVVLSDHLWLDPRRPSRPSVERVLALRAEVDALPPGGPRIVLGAEADCAPGLGLAGGEATRALDVVIAAYHFSDVRLDRTPAPQTPEELAALLVGGFRSLVEAPGVAVAGHPFYLPPRVFHALPDALKSRLGDTLALVAREAPPWFAEARRRGIAVELNAKALGPWNRPLLRPLFALAREAGCRFVLSSDAHRLSDVGRSAELADYAAGLGITPDPE